MRNAMKVMRAAAMLTVVWGLTVEGHARGWRTSTDVDRMTGTTSQYAMSPSMKAEDRMEFPYGDTTSWIGVACDGTDEWAFIGFSNQPNLTNETWRGNGLDQFSVRVQWNSDPRTTEGWKMSQEWGSRFLHVNRDRKFINRLKAERTVRIELRWHGEGRVTFTYTLVGSSDAIKTTIAPCRAKQEALKRTRAEERAKMERLAAQRKQEIERLAALRKQPEDLVKRIREAGYKCDAFEFSYMWDEARGVIRVVCDGCNVYEMGLDPGKLKYVGNC